MTDALSPLLDSLRVRAATIGRFDFGLPWCFAMNYAPTHCLVVLDGRCWWSEPDALPGDGVWLEAGDALVVLRNGRFTFGSAPGLARLPWGDVWRASMPPDLRFDQRDSPLAPMRLSWNTGTKRTQVLAMAFGFEDGEHHPLLAALPDRLVVPRQAHASPWTASALDFLGTESGQDLPGFATLARRLAELLFNDLLRRHLLSSTPAHATGWLRGLTDPALAKALAAMHRQPGEGWTLARLAQQAGLSRTVFSERFLTRVGETPMGYLLAWRMHCARESLAAQRPVGEVASRFGYASERAFRQAFKRLAGTTPTAYARLHRPIGNKNM